MTLWRRVALVAGLMAAVGCGGSSTPPAVHFGHVALLSGPDKTAGEQAARGMRLAVKEAKDAKDAEFFPVAHHTDTRGKQEAYEAEAVRLATINKAVALYGGTTVDEVVRLERSRLPVVTPLGVHTAGMSELVFTTGLAPDFRGKVLARYAVEDLGLRRAVVLADERREDLSLLADAFVQIFAETAAKNDPKAQVARPVLLRFGKDAKFAELTRRLEQEKPDVLLLAVSIEDLSEIAQRLKEAKPAMLYGDGSLTTVPNAMASNALYLATAYVTDAETPINQEFLKQFRHAYSEEPDVHAALGYDGARLLFEAQRRSKGIEPLRAELAKIKDFAGLTGALSFSDQRLQRPAFVVRLEKQPQRAAPQAKTMKRFVPDS